MKELLFKIIDKADITTVIAEDVINLLKKQGKVVTPSIAKIQSCLKIVQCFEDQNLIAIGALKTKSSSDFKDSKADLPNLADKFTWELGYLYVDDDYRNYGISTTLSRLLLKEVIDENVMATTELHAGNAMTYVLEKFGFRQYGKPWPSIKHDGTLGLFLKFKKGIVNDNENNS